MRHFFKKCEEFTLCGGVGDADGLFTHGYPDNYAIYHIIIKGNVTVSYTHLTLPTTPYV